MSDYIVHDDAGDGIDRRGFLKCMAWAGTGVLWTLAGGVACSRVLTDTPAAADSAGGDFSFVQISDTHVGFNKQANTDVVGTLRAAVDRIGGLPVAPDFLLHTGDISHLSKPDEFDTVDQALRESRVSHTFYVPGEHDVLGDNGKQYLARYGKGAGGGWYSFDHKGVHLIGLVNVLNLRAGGLGSLGPEQLAWLAQDVRRLPASTPIVVFAHVPLWSVYPQWGWGTEDGAQALSTLRRFGSVTVLNGHIHQVMQKVEGNVTFHTAMSTAFPQPAPGQAPSPGPMTVPADRLRTVLGLTGVQYAEGGHTLATVDYTLQSGAGQALGRSYRVTIDNFTFAPAAITVPAGSRVTWVNHDDMIHTVVDAGRRFSSPALDTGEQFTHTFAAPGTYPYFCSIHPQMTGRITVQRQ